MYDAGHGIEAWAHRSLRRRFRLPRCERGKTMERRLIDLVLPRLARPLYHHLERYQSGELDETQFTRRFESLLRRQHKWLAKRGVSAARAAVAIHAAVLIL